MSIGKTIKCKAALCWAANTPLTVEDVEVRPPLEGEVRIKVAANALCHTDAHLCAGHVRGGYSIAFPTIIGHEASGVVESVGPDVTSVAAGDHVLTIFLPHCGKCRSCRSTRSNMCQDHPMDFSLFPERGPAIFCKGKPVYQIFTVGGLSQYTVVPEIQVAKIPKEAPLNIVCSVGCGITTGFGAAWKTAAVEKGSTVGIWGLGTVGLATAMGAKYCGASRVIGIDINSDKFDLAKKFGCTEFINSRETGGSAETEIKKRVGPLGLDYTFECIGMVPTAEDAVSSVSNLGGKAVLQGIFPGDKKMVVDPASFVCGKVVTGAMFGGMKGRKEVPQLVDLFLQKKIMVEEFITGTAGLDGVNEPLQALLKGSVLRTVILLNGKVEQ